MSKTILTTIRRLAFSYVYMQAIVIACVTVLLYFLGKNIVAFSFMWGGIVCILPTAYFAHRLFAKTGAQAAKDILASFYICEVIKYIFTFVLFAIAFKYFNINKLALFIGFIVAQVTFWFTAFFRHRTVNRL